MEYIIGEYMPNVIYTLIPRSAYTKFNYPEGDRTTGDPTEEGLEFEKELVELCRKYGMYDGDDAAVANCILPNVGVEEEEEVQPEEGMDKLIAAPQSINTTHPVLAVTEVA